MVNDGMCASNKYIKMYVFPTHAMLSIWGGLRPCSPHTSLIVESLFIVLHGGGRPVERALVVVTCAVQAGVKNCKKKPKAQKLQAAGKNKRISFSFSRPKRIYLMSALLADTGTSFFA